MCPKRRGQFGFTLVEGVFALFIVFTVLSALANTLGSAAEVKQNTQNMDRAIEEFHALITMKNDALAAIALMSPGSGATTNNLRLRKVNPRLSFFDRADTTLPYTGLSDIDPHQTNETLTVEYQRDAADGILKRYVTDPNTTITTAERLLKCETFQCQSNSDDPPLLTLTFTVEKTRVTKTRTIKVARKP